MAGAESKQRLKRNMKAKWHTEPGGETAIHTSAGDPERALYWSPAPSQPSPSTALWGQGSSGKRPYLQLCRSWKGPILVPAHPATVCENLAGTGTHQETLRSAPQEILKYPYFWLQPLQPWDRKLISPPRDLVGDMPTYSSRTRSTDFSLGYGTWNSQGAWF